MVEIGTIEGNPWDTVEFNVQAQAGEEIKRLELSGDLSEYFDKDNATFTWTPGVEDIGVYELEITATDGENVDQQTVYIVINPLEALKFDIKQTPDRAEYPETDALILRRLINYEFYEHNGEFFRLEEVAIMTKLFNRNAINRYGDVRINFNPMSEAIFITEAKTVKADGTVVELRDDAISVITPPELSGSNIYSDMEQLVFNMPSLEENAVIAYSYIRISPADREQIWLYDTFQSIDPIKYNRVKLYLPDDIEVNYKVNNSDVIKEEEELEDDMKLYTWVKEDVEAVKTEFAMPPIDSLLASLLVSSSNSWIEVGNFYKEILPDLYEPSPELKERVKELTEDAFSPEDKIRELYNFVSSNIRYVALVHGLGGIIPSSAVEVYETRYGDCKGQSILLISMLNEIGIEATPVLINVYENPDMDIVSLAQFNHMIVYIPGKDIFLDPTSGSHLYGNLAVQNQGKNVFLPLSNEIKTTPLSSAYDNKESLIQVVDLDIDGNIKANAIIEYFGHDDFLIRNFLEDKNENEQRNFIRDILDSEFSNFTIEEYTISGIDSVQDNISIDMTYEVEGYANNVARNMIINPLMFSIDLRNLIAEETREYPIYIGFNFNVIRRAEINIPDSFVVLDLPENVEIRKDFGYLIVDYEVIDNKIFASYELIIDRPQIEVEYYDEFRELIEGSQQAFRDQIILQK
ncbi:DUF3857 domain-containing protein [Natronospora cellulosivora (SeqCode)]